MAKCVCSDWAERAVGRLICTVFTIDHASVVARSKKCNSLIDCMPKKFDHTPCNSVQFVLKMGRVL